MRACKVLTLFVGLTWVLLLAVLAAGLLLGAGNAASFAVAPLTMGLVLLLTFCGGCCGWLASAREVASELLPDGEEDPPPVRLYWLDNAKTALITMVVVGHSATGFMGSGAFLGLGAAKQLNWFLPLGLSGLALLKPLVVPLFFWISGFLSVSGITRKGPLAFLRASFWRLGPPYFVWWLAVNPLNSLFAYALAQPSAASYSYFPNSAATWFLSWLLVFQCGFALVAPLPSVPRPSFGRLLLLSLAVAVVQLLASLVCALAGATLGFGEMPMAGPGGDGFFNALGFVGGVLARANSWLAEPLPPSLLRPARLYVLAMVVLVPLFFFLTLAPGAPGVALAGQPLWTALFFALQLPLGPHCACVLVLAVDVLQRRCNTATRLSRVLAGGAFAVYLLQYWAVTGFTYAYLALLEQTDGLRVEFVNSTQSSTELPSGQLYLGFAFVAGCSVASSFAVGGLLKLVPGLRGFL